MDDTAEKGAICSRGEFEDEDDLFTNGAGQKMRIVNNSAPHMHDGSITIRIAADVKEIERLNRVVRQFGELHEVPGRALYSVNLALDELVSNAILYGYEDATGQEISIRLSI